MHARKTVELTIPADYQYLEEVSAAIERLYHDASTMDQACDCNEKKESSRQVHKAGAPSSHQPHAIEEQIQYNIKLAVHEICNNIIEHAYAGATGTIEIHLTVDWNPQRFVAELYDSGRSFDPSTVVAPDLDEPHEDGYGLFLAKALMDEVHYLRHGEQNHWRLIKQW